MFAARACDKCIPGTVLDHLGLQSAPSGDSPEPSVKGLASRLRSHASGRRSGDQFCVYVADHYVLPGLSREQIEAIGDSRLSMDALVREKIHEAFGFRFVVVDDYRTAIQVENLVKSGRLQAGRPRLNPAR